jgi:hypothetical protein
MKNLLISGNTLQEWDIEEVLTNKVKSKDQTICDMIQSDWDNTISRFGMTYLEIEQFNNTYNQ